MPCMVVGKTLEYEIMAKSTIQTSRKIYAMHVAFRLLAYMMALYTILELFDKNPSEVIFGAAIVAIGSIVSALHIADGMKGHEDGS